MLKFTEIHQLTTGGTGKERQKLNTGVSPYPRVIHSKTYRGYMKLQIIPNAIYVTGYLCNKHIYGKGELINNGFLNTNTVISQQIMQIVKTLEAEWKQVLQGNMSKETKENESRTGFVWADGFHHLTAHSRLVHVLKLMYHLFL
jgi:hypothetical protein